MQPDQKRLSEIIDRQVYCLSGKMRYTRTTFKIQAV